ncbi:MAG: alkaline phosphatase family protein [Thermoleophilia bacterium]|nr:alkaline phosphatase family protein [Thermoleophilia bacterium]
MNTPGPKLTIVGLDAVTLSIVDPLIESGDLPNLARLLASGTRGVLRSTTHPLTPQAWATMVTGVNAGRHGIWDFAERCDSGYELRVVNGSFRRAPAVWDRLTGAGRRVGLLNVPFTWPPPQVSGFVISGFDTATRDELTHPPDLLVELRRRFGRLELDHTFPIGTGGRFDLDQVRRTCEQKTELALWLAAELAPELLFLVFMSADHVHHLAWTEWESRGRESVVADVYRILDEAVGTLVAGLPGGGDVMVVSDHGAGPLNGVVNLNAWLAEQGFLTYAAATAGLPTRLARGALALRRKALPEGLRRALKRLAPDLSERAVRVSAAHLLDFSRTSAFAYGTFGNIVLNVRGREAEGIVGSGAEYERVRDEIARRLVDLRGPAGERVVRAVHRRESLCSGPWLEKVPDLVVEFEDYAWLGKGNLKSRTPTIWDEVQIEAGSEHTYVGSHRHAGMFALAGPSARAGGRISARIEDVAPTILYLMGEPVPDELEGHVLADALDPGLLERRPPASAAAPEIEVADFETYDEAGAAEIESRLRALGYLE